MKHCSRCGKDKSTKEFYKNKCRPDGLSTQCMDCHNLSCKEYTKRNYETARKNQKRWNRDNPLKVKRYAVWAHAIKRDKEKGRKTSSKKEIYKICNFLKCYYCGFAGLIGIDRIDNSKGHIVGNMLPCCGLCNRIRSNYFTIQQMMLMAEIIRKIRIESNQPICSDEELLELRSQFKKFII